MGETEGTEVEINGKNVNISAALPLTIGDWKKLKAKGLTPEKMGGAMDIDDMSTFLEYLFTKSNPDVTMEDIESLPMNANSGPIRKVMDALGASMEEGNVDVPFSEPSTTSDTSTDGQDQT